MISKLILINIFVFTLMNTTWTAAIFLPDDSNQHLHYDDDDDQQQYHHHVSVASSYMHFHGPVEGPEFEVKVPYALDDYTKNYHLISHHEDHDNNEHNAHGYTIDYFANPKYEFSYGVDDHHTGDFHSQKEVRDGEGVSGEYTVKEPGGTVRVVTYKADENGFHAAVHTSGKNDHSGATYSAHAQSLIHNRHLEALNDDDVAHYKHAYAQKQYA